MDKKNIMLLSNELVEGGSEEIILNLAMYLDKSKYKTYVAGLKFGPMAKVLKEKGIELIKITGKNINKKYLKIKQLLQKLRIDYALFNYLPYGHFFVPSRTKTIEIVHGPYPWLMEDKNYHAALKKASKIVCVSSSVYDFMIKHFKNIQNKMVIIENGINDNKLKITRDPFEIKNKYNIPETNIVIGTLGRICPEKGIGRLLNSARILNKHYDNLTFVIPGDTGRYPDYYKDFVSKINKYNINNVVFTGFIKNVADILQIYDIFAFPSYHDEGLQLALVEALKLGLPVVTTNVGVVTFDKDMKDGEIGYVVKDYSDQLFSMKISKLIEKPGLRKKIGKHNKQIFSKKYLVSDMVSSYEGLLEVL